MRELTREEKRQTKLEHGLVIEAVSGPAARAGISRGDVLLAINGKPATSVDQVRGVMNTKPKVVALLVERDGERIFVPVTLN
jgi:serine protease Do